MSTFNFWGGRESSSTNFHHPALGDCLLPLSDTWHQGWHLAPETGRHLASCSPSCYSRFDIWHLAHGWHLAPCSPSSFSRFDTSGINAGQLVRRFSEIPGDIFETPLLQENHLKNFCLTFIMIMMGWWQWFAIVIIANLCRAFLELPSPLHRKYYNIQYHTLYALYSILYHILDT